MTNDELFHRCGHESCWVDGHVRTRNEGDALWPLGVDKERDQRGMHVWNFHVTRVGRASAKANKRSVCEQHHTLLMQIFESEAAADVREQEVTDAWTVRNQGRL